MIHPQQAAAMLPIVQGVLAGNLIEFDGSEKQEPRKVSCADYWTGDKKQVNPYTDKSVYVTYLDGTMTKYGTCASYGTREIAQELLQADKSSLNCEEVLTALTISATTNPTAEAALNKIGELRGCMAHCTAILSDKDEKTLKGLGIDVTSDPEYVTNNLYYS